MVCRSVLAITLTTPTRLTIHYVGNKALTFSYLYHLFVVFKKIVSCLFNWHSNSHRSLAKDLPYVVRSITLKLERPYSPLESFNMVFSESSQQRHDQAFPGVHGCKPLGWLGQILHQDPGDDLPKLYA